MIRLTYDKGYKDIVNDNITTSTIAGRGTALRGLIGDPAPPLNNSF